MATWEDGPEYAPHQRPDQFAAPEQVTPLDAGEPRPQPSRGAPEQVPTGFEMQHQVAPLASLAPAAQSVRDPHQAFEVMSSAMTEQSFAPAAWGAAHSSSWAPPTGDPVAAAPPLPAHDPHQPFAVGAGMRPGQEPLPPAPGPAMPAPGTEQWFAPTSWAPPQPRTDDRTLMRQVLDGATLPVLITLAIGLIPMLAPFCVVIAFVLTRMVPRRRAHLRIAYLIGLGVMLLTGLTGFVTTLTWDGTVSALRGPAALFCLVMLFLSPVISYLSINAGEPEERPQGSTRGSSSWG